MWRREAPRARRRPISPVRSITDTSVTLAIPIAPISNATPPSSKKQIEIGLDRLPDSFWLGGSSHHEQARLVGPESERDLFGDPGSSLRFGSPPPRAQDRSAGRWAVPSGMITAPNRSGWRAVPWRVAITR